MLVKENSWVEISKSALIYNFKQFTKIIGPKVKLLVAVKANAYGHGLVDVSRILEKNNVDFLGVNSLEEAEILRRHKIHSPILIMGYIRLNHLKKLEELAHVSIVTYNKETVYKLGRLKKKIKIHLKLETGTARQGIYPKDLPNFINIIKKFPNIEIEGIYTHFANIEDTLNHGFAFEQLKIFQNTIISLAKQGINVPFKHSACSAATILYPETHFDLVRAGIGIYGLWSSHETQLTAKNRHKNIFFKPVLSWKSVIAQVKRVKSGSTIGYGRTEKVFRDSKIAVIPVGYFDGYDRGLSSIGNVLIKGQRVKIMGRICMNMLMVDVTDINNVKLEDEAVLIGKQGREAITVEEIANKINTINYEVVSRINPFIQRVVVK